MEGPIKLEAYRCPKCNGIIEGTREEAQRHFDVPVSRALPVGLVLSKGNPDGYHEIIVDNTKICQDDHEVFHEIYSFISGRVIKEPSFIQNLPHGYEMIVTELKEGILKFLTEDELRRVEEAHRSSTSGIYSRFPNIELIRTAEGLEQLVPQ